jgi:peptidoglycan hydrolase-like protein with peptidoglycan-binding domain
MSRGRGAVSGPLIALGSLVVAAATAVGVVVALPVEPPAALATATPAATVAVTQRSDADDHQVQLALDTGAPRAVVTTRVGTVTASSCTTGGVLRSGVEIARIDDVPVIALATETPLYRDLAIDDRGDDVRGLQQELARLGVPVTVDGIVGRGTLRAAQGFLLTHGFTRDDLTENTIERSAFAWIPSAETTVRTCTAVVGAPVDADGVLVELPAELRSARVEQLPADAMDGARRVVVGSVRAEVDEQGVVTGPSELAAIGALPEYATTVASADGVPSLPASWSLRDPLEVRVVPPTALWDVHEDHACVQPAEGQPLLVEVIGSELGQSFVRLDPGPALDPSTALDRVRATPDRGRSCR